MMLIFIFIIFQTFLLLNSSYANSGTDQLKSVRLPLTYRHAELSHNNNDNSLRFKARMRSDARRVATLSGRVPDAGPIDVHDLDEYVVTIGVGTPPILLTLPIDTGSDLVWVKCQPCDSCSNQFDPANSTSLQWVPCEADDLACYKVDEKRRGCDKNKQCTYKVNYGDKSYTEGVMVFENITLGDVIVGNVLMGCGHNNKIMTFTYGDGMLGLGRGSLSLASQSGGLIGGAFSFCLSDAGWLDFGRSNFSANASWATLISNPKSPSYYYIELLDIKVDGESAGIPVGTFQLTPEGDDGVIIDTGTVVTHLPEAAYIALRDKFKEKMGNLLVSTPPPSGTFYTCYNPSSGFERVPNVSFIFSSLGFDPPNITVEASRVLIQVDGIGGPLCFGFAKTDMGLTIIGNKQLEGIQISFDTSGGFVGFGSAGAC